MRFLIELIKKFVLILIGKWVKRTVLVVVGIVAALFVVYFWNLDQKLLGWAYKQVNLIFDEKKVDQVF
ncbi:MAG: hypothetical protein IJV51_05205 [Oscillospiraceae bacterium]|jgi:hypothetical protein|nr:hypothetical protein [Oscillospiraceae bacterium]